MSPEFLIVIVAAVVVVGLLGLSVTLRRAFEPASPPIEPPLHVGPALTADEVAYRIGVTDAPFPTGSDIPPPAPSGAAATAAAARAAAARATAHESMLTSYGTERSVPAPVAPTVAPPPPRSRVLRDAGFALIALSAIALVAVVAWPHGPAGGRPTGSFVAVAPASATPHTTPKATPAPPVATATPMPTPVPTPVPTAVPTPIPPLIPTETPLPTALPTAAPTPKATAKPTAQPASATPRPTARPTPTPTPKPTPKPTPVPTPTPTPTPAAPHAVIGVSAPCTDPNGSISFTGSNSTGEDSYLWDFDDNNATSTQANPSHSFDGAQSSYLVILKVTGPGGSDPASTVINVPC